METICLTVNTPNSEEQIFKLYGDNYEVNRETATLTDIAFTPDAEAGFWSWVGRLSVSGAVVGKAGGLRVRLRNIQVGGTDLIEDLFSEIKPSYRRFTYYYVGEIHVSPKRVIPNARRDNFEETSDWMDTKAVIRQVLLDPLRKDAYAESKKEAQDVTKLIQDIQELVDTSRTLSSGTRGTYDRVVDLMTQAKRLRRRVLSAQKRYQDVAIVVTEHEGAGIIPSIAVIEDASKSVEEVESAAKMMMGWLPDQDEKLESLKARIREHTIREILDVVQVYVDASAFQRIKKHIQRSED
jgi:molecular chaperone HtpG